MERTGYEMTFADFRLVCGGNAEVAGPFLRQWFGDELTARERAL